MNRAEARQWLASRRPPPPPPLLELMDRTLAALPAEPAGAPTLASRLGDAAVACLARALEKGAAREAAFDLLAADALLTYGCEAAVEAGPGAVAAFAEGYDAARLARLLD